jgi:hypothetical protein
LVELKDAMRGKFLLYRHPRTGHTEEHKITSVVLGYGGIKRIYVEHKTVDKDILRHTVYFDVGKENRDNFKIINKNREWDEDSNS